jgi:endoglucanase Acf2
MPDAFSVQNGLMQGYSNSIQFISSTDHYTWYGTSQRLIHNINIIV